MTATIPALDAETLELSLKSLRDFAKDRLPDETLRQLDARDECPLDIVHAMCGPELGIPLLFVCRAGTLLQGQVGSSHVSFT